MKFVVVIWHEVNGKNAWMVVGKVRVRSETMYCRSWRRVGRLCPYCRIAPDVPRASGERRFCLIAEHMQTAKGTSASHCHPNWQLKKKVGFKTGNWLWLLLIQHLLLPVSVTARRDAAGILSKRCNANTQPFGYLGPILQIAVHFLGSTQHFPDYWHRWQSEQVDLRSPKDLSSPRRCWASGCMATSVFRPKGVLNSSNYCREEQNLWIE